MKRIAYDSTVLTDELLDKLAAEYEDGTWKGKLEEVARGRLNLCKDELEATSFQLSTTTENLVERFDDGKDVTDYFDFEKATRPNS